MNADGDAELDQVLCLTATGNPRLLSALRNWRREMPDALLQAALTPQPINEMVAALKIEPNRISHTQLLAHLHFNLSGHLRDHSLEPVLRAARLRNGLRNKKLLLERNEIMARLQAHGLNMLVFKGADLAYSVYPDPCCRVVGDIDLLIEEMKYERATKTLLAEGFIPLDRSSLQTRKGITKITSWTHPEFTISLDIQIHANHHATWSGADQLYFTHAVTRGDAANGEILALCPEHALVQVCGHGLAQNFYPPVRWAADAVWILRSAGGEFNWDLALEAVHNNHSAPILSVAMNYLRIVLGTEIPQEAISQLNPTLSRRTFQTAWSYRLDQPNGQRERIAGFVARFRETCPDEKIWHATGRLPNYLRDSQNTSSVISAIGKLARKVIMNKYG